MNVYPNPFKESLFSQVAGNNETTFTVKIADGMGKIVNSKRVAVSNHSVSVNGLSGLPAGLYCVSVHSRGERVFQQKVIKE